MGFYRRRGFTLIELLVVIAIIGILAAMVFPVFARARESARKAVCLSNVKNVGLAVQMYLADNNDTLPPAEHRQEVMDYISSAPGGGDPADSGGCRSTSTDQPDRVEGFATWANPYLRWPVIFDEYVKNRDVWRCPSAKVEVGATFILPGPDWVGYLRANEGQWGHDSVGGACQRTYPPGWGGAVTDSILQQRIATAYMVLGQDVATSAANKAFVQSIGMREGANERKMVQVEDPVRFVICGDAGVDPWSTCSAAILAYPDICCAECAGIAYYAWDGWPDPNGCPDGTYCPDCVPLHANINWARDPNRHKETARHLGGDNLGFLDGHASWLAAGTILAMHREGELECTYFWCTPCESPEAYRRECEAEPDPGMIFLY
jgi:prepilin-type N-terminal cleavage/methylation domain-containing protein